MLDPEKRRLQRSSREQRISATSSDGSQKTDGTFHETIPISGDALLKLSDSVEVKEEENGETEKPEPTGWISVSFF